MPTTIVDSLLFAVPTVVPTVGDAHDSTTCHVDPHQAHGNNTAQARERHNALATVLRASSGYTAGTIGSAVETLVTPANSATVGLDVAAGELSAGESLVVYATMHITGSFAYNYIGLYDNVSAASWSRACSALPVQTTGPPYIWYPTLIAQHTVTAPEAANGLALRVHNSAASGGSIVLRVPWQISLYRLL